MADKAAVVELEDLGHSDSGGDAVRCRLVDGVDLDHKVVVHGCDKVFLSDVLNTGDPGVLEPQVREEFGEGQARHVVDHHVLGSEQKSVLGTVALVDNLRSFGFRDTQSLEDDVVGKDVAFSHEAGGELGNRASVDLFRGT